MDHATTGEDCDPASKEECDDHSVKTTFAFGSAGWLFVYYFGVIKALKEYGLNQDFQCIGTSGGALAAAAGLCLRDTNLDDIKDYILVCAREARSSPRGLFKLRQYCQGAIDRFTREEDVPAISGKVEVSTTVLPFLKNKRIKHFRDLQHLTQCLHASSCLIPLCGGPVHVDGVGWCIDGGVSDFQLLRGLMVGGTFFKVHDRKALDSKAVIVCPFYSSRADIKPSRYIPPWWAFFPPSAEELQGVYLLGYTDTLDYIKRNPEHHQESWVASVVARTSTVFSAAEHSAQEAAEYLREHIPDMHVNEHMQLLSSSFQHTFPYLYQQIENIPSLGDLGSSFGIADFEIPQCLSDLGSNVSGPMYLLFSFVRQILVVLTAIMVYVELFIQAVIWGLATGCSFVMPGHSPWQTGGTWLQLIRTFASPRLALRAVPVVGRFVKFQPHKMKRLEDLSVVFRLLSFVVV